MTLTAEFQLRSRQLPLVEVAAAVPEVTLRLEGTEQPQSGPAVFFIKVTGSSFSRVDAALTESSSVSESVLISEIESIRMYQVILEGARPTAHDERMFQRTFPENVTIMSDGWFIKQQFVDRDEFRTAQEFWRTMGFSIHLDRLYDSQTTDTELIGLSNKQREALLTAYQEGYFAVPKQTSLEEVAEKLDISHPALAERLHRAQAHLIEHFYHTDLY